MKQWKSLVALSLIAVTAGLGLSVCGGSDDSSSSSAPTTKAPEDILVSNAQVTAGLATLRTAFEDAEAAISSKSATVKTYPDKLNELWFAVEGRIKKNDSLSYINFEDALARMVNAAKSEKAADVQKALDQFTTTADGYLAKFPRPWRRRLHRPRRGAAAGRSSCVSSSSRSSSSARWPSRPVLQARRARGRRGRGDRPAADRPHVDRRDARADQGGRAPSRHCRSADGLPQPLRTSRSRCGSPTTS